MPTTSAGSSGSASVTHVCFFFQSGLNILFHLWVTKFVHLQLIHLGTFSLGRRFKDNVDFGAYLPMITGHHSDVTLSTRSPVDASAWSMGVARLPYLSGML